MWTIFLKQISLILLICGINRATNPTTTPAAAFANYNTDTPAPQPLTDDNFTSIFPIVCTQDGCIEGRATPGYQIDEYESFFGIPYAEPPVGKLRFAVCNEHVTSNFAFVITRNV